jgi:hypothetical protein
VSRRLQLGAVIVACVLPRLAVLALERGDILAEFTEKSDDFARTFVESGTFGFIPGEPSAYTQPLYGWFLIPLYEIARHWLVVGLAQIAVALVTALLVMYIGNRILGPPAGAVAAVVATLSPYLVWHDVHVNREILDSLIAAALVVAVLAAAERPTVLRGVGVGAVTGLALLANARLTILLVVLPAYLLWRGRGRAVVPSVALLAAAALVLVPWVVRNDVQVGCATITTDARALWKANNLNTYETLRSGKWIDDVPELPGAEPTPEMAGAIYRDRGEVIPLDECAQMRLYRRLATDFWRDHPGEKAKLAVLGVAMLWDPRVSPSSESSPGAGTWRDRARSTAVPVYMVALFLFALLGLRRLRRTDAVLVVTLLVTVTVTAIVFVGATRYRVPWDFLLALAAAPAVIAVWHRLARGRMP